MNSSHIESNLKAIVDVVNKENFIYDLLLAYGISRTSIARLKKGDFNLSKVDGEVLYKNKIFFKIEKSDRLLIQAEESAKDLQILKQNPRFIVITDFETIIAKDLKKVVNADFPIKDLPNYKDFFIPLSGGEIYKSSNDNKADRDAAYKLAQLYDILVTDNPDIYIDGSHNLNLFLSRLLFCFFAEDTDIFKPKSIFTDTLANNTLEDGSDTHVFLNALFERLNNENGNFPAYLSKFPYVNGGLFKDSIHSPLFSSKSRNILLESGNLDWSEINPDIFGSMIQAVADPEERSDLGMHYTSVPNILKLIRPLFLDELYEIFENNKDNERNLHKLINRISKIKFFDPACGSGNFLIIIYKEIRALEINIIKRLIEIDAETGKQLLYFTNIRLSQFYGIEIKDFAHEMAVLSLWLVEHQMNQLFDEKLEGYGESKPILPLKEAGHITCDNAARIRWEDVCAKDSYSEIYVIGNPPYLGYSRQDDEQKKDIDITFSGIKNYKKLDYISCWFYKATLYIQDTTIKYAFVSTKSITQGEQVALMWPLILNRNQEIFFAHQSFKWTNNAKGNAGVSVIIVGIRNIQNKEKVIFRNNIRQIVSNISPYLTNGGNLIVQKRSTPLSNLPVMMKGSQPTDGGHLLLDSKIKENLITNFPELEIFIKRYIGANEYISDEKRYCLWLDNDDLARIKTIDEITKRLELVKLSRETSTKSATRKLASSPHKFGEIRYFNKESIIVPTITSERRDYIPCGFLDSDTVISNTAQAVYNFEPYIFGIISSRMMLTWVKAIGGKFKTDYIFSSTLCYNTFPFPDIKTKQKEIINQYVFQILDERARFPEKTMAWLYDPKTMPFRLKQAHKELDEAIERLYRLNPFSNDSERLEQLFKVYEDMSKINTLFTEQKKVRSKKTKHSGERSYK